MLQRQVFGGMGHEKKTKAPAIGRIGNIHDDRY
jgi:hypothetical protein